MKLESKLFTLRPINKNDLISIQKYANQKDVHKYMGRQFPFPYSIQDAENFFLDTKKKSREKKSLRLGIYHKQSKEVIGMIGFESIDFHSKKAELGYWLGKPFWGKGIISSAVKLMVNYGFKSMKLNKVYSRVYHSNIGSQKVLKKMNFKLEGTLRKHDKLHSRYVDTLMFGLLKSDNR